MHFSISQNNKIIIFNLRLKFSQFHYKKLNKREKLEPREYYVKNTSFISIVIYN